MAAWISPRLSVMTLYMMCGFTSAAECENDHNGTVLCICSCGWDCKHHVDCMCFQYLVDNMWSCASARGISMCCRTHQYRHVCHYLTQKLHRNNTDRKHIDIPRADAQDHILSTRYWKHMQSTWCYSPNRRNKCTKQSHYGRCHTQRRT